MDSSYKQLEEQKLELDQLIIKVSKEMRSRDYDIRDLNYKTVVDKEHLGKQVDIMSRELYEARQDRDRLELIEGDLLHKL